MDRHIDRQTQKGMCVCGTSRILCELKKNCSYLKEGRKIHNYPN